MKELIIQDFSLSQLEPTELSQTAARPCVQDFITELQDIVGQGVQEHYGFDNMLGVINAPRDEELRARIAEVVAQLEQHCGPEGIRHVVHCGIGGSELGASMVIAALGNRERNYYPITSLNNDHIAAILQRIDPARTVLIKATRSNRTQETLSAFDVFARHLRTHCQAAYARQCVAIVGPEHAAEVKQQGYHFIPIVPSMSGRFSGLHAANLFTMRLMGVDIEGLHQGARTMLRRCTAQRDLADNPALAMAVHLYLMNTQKGKVVFNTGIFAPQLVKYGDWLGQLLEESLVHHQDIALVTKTSELSNKAHSYFQGWLAGANITYHQFVFPVGQNCAQIATYTGASLREIEFAEYRGIVQALAQQGRFSYTTWLASISPQALGQLMMRDMLATLFLGQLYGLRVETVAGRQISFGYFHQPAVQAYKQLMQRELDDLDQLRQTLQHLERSFNQGGQP